MDTAHQQLTRMGIYPVLRMEGSLRATGGTFKVPSRVGGNGLAPWGFCVFNCSPYPASWEPPTKSVSFP